MSTRKPRPAADPETGAAILCSGTACRHYDGEPGAFVPGCSLVEGRGVSVGDACLPAVRDILRTMPCRCVEPRCDQCHGEGRLTEEGQPAPAPKRYRYEVCELCLVGYQRRPILADHDDPWMPGHEHPDSRVWETRKCPHCGQGDAAPGVVRVEVKA